jgi:hypothetical protein
VLNHAKAPGTSAKGVDTISGGNEDIKGFRRQRFW